MIVLDTNILVYAHHPQLPQHKKVAKWLEALLSDSKESIAMVWPAVSGFIRISTNRRIFEQPMTADVANHHISALFSHPSVHQLNTTDEHWRIFSSLLSNLRLAGDLVADAHIAAIAIEHRASIASTDKDFRRFSDHVKIIDPLAKMI
ncbi:MAG: TA system VapC family ribonuclease toxin [Pyrinomonadaceae bacterium]